MRIKCPHCGLRAVEEFTAKGDASALRPAPEAGHEAHFRQVFMRQNRRGRHAELWQHDGGCRAWLVVERDTLSHEIYSVVSASDYVVKKRQEATS